MKTYLAAILLLISPFAFSQSTLNGIVKNANGEAILAANVYLKSAPQNGVVSDLNGNFSVNSVNVKGVLVVASSGYDTKEIPLNTLDTTQNITVVLEKSAKTLEEVVITAKDPISEQFSVVKMTMLEDVYFNPVAQGDPLKAITTLPASTNTEETANPSLRGSGFGSSRVILNGVPIYNPVRATNISNIGLFSIFTPLIIDKQYVYASNPPLTYGNTIAGLVEIQTLKNIDVNNLQLSLGLGGASFLLSQKISEDTSFIQIYGNNQFSDALIAIQTNQYPNLKSFSSKDLGINFYSALGENAELNSYNYYINESHDASYQDFAYKGPASASNERIFTVNNLTYYSESGTLSLNNGIDASLQKFSFGNMTPDQKKRHIYTSLDYKWDILENSSIQLGVSHDFNKYSIEGTSSSYYYALSPQSPKKSVKKDIDNHNLEAFSYQKWGINPKLTLSSGIRSNIPVMKQQKHYLSYQLGAKYRFNNKQSLLLSGGKYHSYSIPNPKSIKYNLLSSEQVALDYNYTLENTSLTAATYFKNEKGDQTINTVKMNNLKTVGIEFSIKHDFYQYFTFSLSNAFIHQRITIDEETYKGPKDLNYFITSSIKYNNPSIFMMALTYMGRPGRRYTEITGAGTEHQGTFYQPIFSQPYQSQLKSYNRFDLTFNKYIQLPNSTIVTFATVNNIFNSHNPKRAIYNKDYSSKSFQNYALRTFYFGAVWQLSY